ncbi:MAG: glycerol-3-phosphate 1-O-acyltransferase PlsY [Candidatus Omnitrophica bacterium]|nr:glycerol-3-phosphate 1-O-acyltransferase PlsY [Candidatus Omnitrophota bacterium]
MFIFKMLVSFLIGSFPTGLLVARIFKTDIRKGGSGNIGATNVWRVVGRIPGLFVLAIDILKGYFVVALLVPWMAVPLNIEVPEQRLILGIAVIIGHIFSVFLKFKGGKGVATLAGVLFALDPKIFFLCLLTWMIVFVLCRYVSLASICAVVSLPVFLVIFSYSLTFIVFGVVVALTVTFKHLANIRRLVAGEESKFLLRKQAIKI